MNTTRRETLQIAGIISALTAAGLLGVTPAHAARPEGAFSAKSVDDVLKELGIGSAGDGAQVQIQSPEIAENGMVVPVTITSNMPNTTEMYILVEKNPSPMGAGFILPAGTEASVQTRLKMAESSNLIALVKADGQWVRAVRETKVTLGGCGG